MPKKLDRCVADLIKKGYSKSRAFAICTASLKKPKKKPKKKSKKK